MRMRRRLTIVARPPSWAVVAATLLVGCTHPDRSDRTASGAELYAGCRACHGADGAGDRALGAPAIAGLPAWYVEAQLVKFQTGGRGAHPDDGEGLRMRPMARQLANADEVAAVARFVAKLPPRRAPPVLTGGNAEAGAARFAACTACHGADARGNEALHAPPLVRQGDWYLLAELQKFKAGIRGTAPTDGTGAQMRPMALTLADQQAMKDVIAHIETLRN